MLENPKQACMLVAVATKGDGQINQHFGHADSFAIYEVGSGGARFIEQRLVEHYCQGGYGDEDKREAILRTLAGCSACFVARIGNGPAEKLTAAGIEAVGEYPYADIEASLMAWFAKDRPVL